MNTEVYIMTPLGWRAVYYLQKANVYFIRLTPDTAPIQVYPMRVIWLIQGEGNLHLRLFIYWEEGILDG